MALDWPYILTPSRMVWRKAGTSRSGGRSLTGTQQVVRSDAGYWEALWEGPVYHEARMLAYRAIYAGLDGMAGEIDVPCITPWRPYNVNGRMLGAWSAAGFAPKDLGLFDHAGLGQTEVESIWVAEAAPLRATRLVLRCTGPEGLRPGHYFGIGHRLYLVSHAYEVAGGSTPETYMFEGEAYTFAGEPYTFGVGEASGLHVHFWPPLREAVAADTPLILGRPVCRMRLASDETGVLDHGVEGVARPTIELVEAL